MKRERGNEFSADERRARKSVGEMTGSPRGKREPRPSICAKRKGKKRRNGEENWFSKFKPM